MSATAKQATKCRPIKLPSSQQINQWRQSFIALNTARLEQARSLLLDRQKRVLDVLPALIHLNHPQLPGFISHDVPAGIEHYTPPQSIASTLHQIAKGFRIPRAGMHRGIESLFLMGSLGTLGQSTQSDLDVWLCHADHLTGEQLDLLKQKCQLIEQWAEQQKVELHFFFINACEFREGKQQTNVDEEHSGSTQHLLLLDEFYRGSLWLAGRQPIWWLIPVAMEKNSHSYLRQLKEQQLIHDHHWINLGSVATIPPSEFVGAGLWQLNKGLKNPYKSLIKLQLTRHYASQYPNIRPLCWDLKDKVHSGNTDPLACDGYLFMLRRVSDQISAENDHKRLELLRRAFYFKAKLPISKASQGQRKQWRYQELLTLIQEWDWTDYQLHQLDHRESWSPLEVLKERNALVHEMLSSYRYLAAFSNKYTRKVRINRQDLTLLGNQLYAVYDAKPGKLLNINPGISPDMRQEKMVLALTEQKRWQLITGTYNKEGENKPLKQSPSLMELLCYSHFNGLLTQHTNFAIYPEHNSLTKYELKELLQVVRNISQKPPAGKAFLGASIPVQWHLFINAGIDPMHHFSRRGMQKLSNRDDALGYSALKENLIHSIDLLTINSWGEWRIQRFEGNSALVDAMHHILQHLPLAKKYGWPPAHCHCHCASRASAIRQRVEELLSDIQSHHLQHPKADYLMELGRRYYIFSQERSSIRLSAAETPTKLLQLLGRERDRYNQYILDKSALSGSPLRPIFEHAKAGTWQLFYWKKEEVWYCYLLDEKGVLLHQQQSAESSNEILIPVIRFMRQADQRQQLQQQRNKARPILLFELKLNPESGEFQRHARRLPSLNVQTSQIQLNAVLDDQDQVTLYCNGQEFSIWEWGEDIYQKAAEALLDIRQNHQFYPAYLTDLAMQTEGSLIRQLRFKHRIEKQLNSALAQLCDQPSHKHG